jgi:hypothetical protein
MSEAQKTLASLFVSSFDPPQKKRKFRPRLKKPSPPIPFDNSNRARFVLDEKLFMAALASDAASQLLQANAA